jgi:alpha-glucosidase
MGASPVRLDAPGELLLASGPVTIEDGTAYLPPDTTAWWSL